MAVKHRIGLICLVVAAMLGSLTACGSGAPAEEGSTPTALPTLPPTPSAIDPSVQGMDMVQVIGVVNGDTIEVIIESKPVALGYLGVHAPEVTDQGSPGETAASANAELLGGHWVFLEGDGGRDSSGRLLRHVWLPDGRLINEEIVRLGLARVETAGLDESRRERLLAAQAAAVADKAALIEVSSIRLDGTGKAQPDEHIEITNPGEQGLDMSGWRAEAGHVDQFFVFPTGFTLPPGETCRLYTNQVLDDSCGDHTCGHDKPILNNGGDCGQFYDALGLLIVERCVKRGEN